MMSSEEDTECFGLYDKLLINTNISKKGFVGAGNNSLILSNSNSNSSSSSNISNCSGVRNNKHNRKRIEAGKPRNSYSSIPNFSSRPNSFTSSASAGSGGLYGTILNQSQSAHFVGGLFGPNGFGSAKMLNEIFGRQMKQAQDATSGLPTSLVENAMLATAMESATSVDLLSASFKASFNSSKLFNNNCIANIGSGVNVNSAGSVMNNNNNNDCTYSNSTPLHITGNQRTSCDQAGEGGSTSPQQHILSNHQQPQQQLQQQNDLAHHMLRNILQGKKDLMALDQELRSVISHHNNSSNLSPHNDGGGSDSVVFQEINFNSKNNNINTTPTTTQNNNNDSCNRNLSNGCSTAVEVSSNTKSSLNNSNIVLKSSVSVLMNALGGCAEVKIKCEPIASTAPQSNMANSNCIEYSGSNNLSESGGCESKNSTERKKYSNELIANVDNVASESHGELLSSEVHQAQLDQQSDSHSAISNIVAKKEADDLLEDELLVLSSRSDLGSLGSPSNSEINDTILDSAKDDLEEELTKDPSSTTNENVGGLNPVVSDVKRARVENIVSSMQSSPSSHHQSNLQVNGCKKRKLYQPQQHAMERYAAAAAGLNFGLNIQSLMLEEEEEEDELESPQIQQKRVEKNALKSQLRSMQEQLAEMQQKYVQLCSRMEQESECLENDEASDSIDQDENQGDISPTLSLINSTHIKNHPESISTSPTLCATKQNKSFPIKTTVTNAPHMLTQMMGKMMSSNLHRSTGEHSHFQQTFNQSSSLFHNVPQASGDHTNANMTHPAISNATAIYLGQQFLLEQEVRIAKEVTEKNERHQQKHQQLKHHENHVRLEQEHQQQQESHTRQKEHQQQRHQHPQRQQQTNDMQQSESQSNALLTSQSHTSQPLRAQHSQQMHAIPSTQSSIKSEISEKFNMLRSHSSSTVRMSGSDLEGLADVLKSEITTSLSALVDTIVTRFVHHRRLFNKQSQSVAAAADQLNKDLLMASQILDRKSPRTKVSDQSSSSTITASLVKSSPNIPVSSQSGNTILLNSNNKQTNPTNSSLCNSSSASNSQTAIAQLANHSNANRNSCSNNRIVGPRINGSNMAFASPSGSGMPMQHSSDMNGTLNQSDDMNSNNLQSPHVRPSPSAALFQTPKTPQSMNPVAAAALYNSISGLGGSGSGPHTSQINPFCMPEPRDQNNEQNEALSLVVTPKKKRHKVTDTRITPRTVSRLLAQDGVVGPSSVHTSTIEANNAPNNSAQQSKYQNPAPASSSNLGVVPTSTTPSQSPSPRPNQYHPPPPPPPMMPVSLPTSVAIPNPSLHESQVFSPYSPFFNSHHCPHGPHVGSRVPPTAAQMHHMKMSSSPPGIGGIIDTRDSPPLPHPPTMLHPALLAAAHHGNSPDYSAHLRAAIDAQDRSSDCNSADMQFDGIQPTISFLKQQMIKSDSLTPLHSSTLTPMHLRKAKLMFFWVRYPSSAVLKMYFPDIKFNKNNTAQLVKWFSNFREFYYIQMEKYARQAVTEGVKNGEDLHVGGDSELYRVLNLHYNRNNHIEVPSNFRFVVEQTLREFFRAIQGGKDTEQSWKKSIYKIISRMDDPVPEYFKTPNFLEQLE